MTPRFPIEDDALCAQMLAALARLEARIDASHHTHPTSAANIPTPLFRVVNADARLSMAEKHAVTVLWLHLSPSAYLPLKMASFGALIGKRREAAAKVMRRLIACGYVDCIEPADRSQPREFLMVNVGRARAA